MPRLAKSLERLRYEINVLYPKRSKTSDGWVADKRHRKAGKSDHIENAQGVVCAIDITHDMMNGADMQAIADYILKYRHPALSYVIFNRSIASQKSGWKWNAYTGSNPHNKHMHVSVVQDAVRYDIEGTWLKNFKQELDEKVKLLVNDKPFHTFLLLGEVSSLVKAINGVNGVKASFIWNGKTKTGKLYVRREK